MSHIEEGKTRLVFADLPALLRQGNQEALAQHPCIALLRQAITLVAKEFGGEVKAYYYDFMYDQQPTNTGLALHIPSSAARSEAQSLPRGIGLVLDETTGALTFLGDPWMVDEEFYQRIQGTIVQKYTALAHMAAMRQMQYQVSTQQIENTIAVTGGTYAA